MSNRARRIFYRWQILLLITQISAFFGIALLQGYDLGTNTPPPVPTCRTQGYPVESTVGCQAAPPCAAPNILTCTSTKPFCLDNYTPFTGYQDGFVPITSVPTNKYEVDTDIAGCRDASCDAALCTAARYVGGTTRCEFNRIPPHYNAVITNWRTSLYGNPTNRIRTIFHHFKGEVQCNRFNPTCDTCCTNWSCGATPTPTSPITPTVTPTPPACATEPGSSATVTACSHNIPLWKQADCLSGPCISECATYIVSLNKACYAKNEQAIVTATISVPDIWKQVPCCGGDPNCSERKMYGAGFNIYRGDPCGVGPIYWGCMIDESINWGGDDWLNSPLIIMGIPANPRSVAITIVADPGPHLLTLALSEWSMAAPSPLISCHGETKDLKLPYTVY